MSILTAYDPLVTFNTLNEWFNGELQDDPTARVERNWYPAVDILENEDAFLIKIELPEVDEKAIDMKIDHQVLSIRGERKMEEEGEKLKIRRRERSHGSFERAFRLPDTVDCEKVHAAMKQGVLTITLPKKEETKPRTVKVEIK
ncbi:MAG: Hsp20/alpha crystallin family protein [Deltaproteobacteria bacterium]|nr:Hsp20/alpha crystallin family protein [Deltaproteobacteria bacterium]